MIHKSKQEQFQTITHSADFCVVGGGISGLVAAIAAARKGTKTLLIQDRPVLGGNASSEVRMWIRGAGSHGENLRETGILEEIALENIYRNPNLNFSIWDSVLYEKAQYQENLKVLLNCSCCDAVMEGDSIVCVKAWQTTTQMWHTVSAKIFSDCSGDSVLAPLTGAEWRMGRESSAEFDEDIAPTESDHRTMGLSCMFQARETSRPVKYTPPTWANRYDKDSFPMRLNLSTPQAWSTNNLWWIELGGMVNSIDDTEQLRDELLKIAFGVWDFIKNGGYCDAENWDLEWVGFLPGKRESRRYIGDHILTQNDVRSEGKFDDLIAYGGWSMDDHHPKGFETREAPTIFHPAPAPYGIPYRCLYSKNIKNLMFAGRNISATHSALSSARVMATCALLGQAVGTAVAIATQEDLLPRDIYTKKIRQLQQQLMEDDCYLPWNKRQIPALTQNAKLTADGKDAAVLINGVERPVDDEDNAWTGKPGSEIVLDFGSPAQVNGVRMVLDSDLNRESWEGIRHDIKTFPMRFHSFLADKDVTVPATLVRSFEILADSGDGVWQKVYEESNNYQRLVRVDLNVKAAKIKLIPKETWGSEQVRIFAFDAK